MAQKVLFTKFHVSLQRMGFTMDEVLATKLEFSAKELRRGESVTERALFHLGENPWLNG